MNASQNIYIKQHVVAVDKVNATISDSFLLYTNNVLSKNPYAGNAYSNLIKKESNHVSFGKHTWLLSKYFIKSLVYLSLWVCKKIVFSFVRGGRVVDSDYLHIIDIFILSKNSVQSNKFNDRYLYDLIPEMDRHSVNYAYLPCFYKDGFNPLNWYKNYKILKKSRFQSITEFELISWVEVIDILVFLIVYPFSLKGLIKHHKIENHVDDMLNYSLKLSIGDHTVPSFIRYLVGKNIAKKYYNSKLLSYSEFQVTDRAIYKGIRDFSKDIRIYAYQQFIKSPVMMNTYISENESDSLVPDKIIVTGSYYVPSTTKYNYDTLSVRFNKVFNTTLHKKRENTLVLLPHYLDKARHVLRLVSRSNAINGHIITKPHPTLIGSIDKELINPNWCTDVGDVHSLFKDAKIVITSSSSVAIEAVSMGISVIEVEMSDVISLNSLIGLGRGIIWEKVESVSELDNAYNVLEEKRVNNSKEIMCISQEYLSLFFSKPTLHQVMNSFDYYNKGGV